MQCFTSNDIPSPPVFPESFHVIMLPQSLDQRRHCILWLSFVSYHQANELLNTATRVDNCVALEIRRKATIKFYLLENLKLRPIFWHPMEIAM